MMPKKRQDRLRPGSPAAHARDQRWKHNSFFGHARMMMMQAMAIQNSQTTTDQSKYLAGQVFYFADQLADSLKIRKPRT